MMFIGIGHCLRHALWQRLSETLRDSDRVEASSVRGAADLARYRNASNDK